MALRGMVAVTVLVAVLITDTVSLDVGDVEVGAVGADRHQERRGLPAPRRWR